jgi:hypothetical protein
MEWAAELNRLLDAELAVPLMVSSASQAAVLAGLLETAARKLDALSVAVVEEVDRQRLYREDGHRSATGWVSFTCTLGRGEATRRAGLGRMFGQLPATAVEYRAGRLGREQVSMLLDAFSNPRCGHLLAGSEDMLLADAGMLTAREFKICVRRWEQLADTDGAKQRHDTQHQFRDARIFQQFDGGFVLKANFGPLQGATIKEIFERFLHTETLADWDAARVLHGPDVTPVHLERTKDTSVNNGGPLCGAHNRFKERGYRTWRDPNGTWHTTRPDGTQLQPAA